MKKPFIIGIGGSHSGSGKTVLVSALLKYLTSRNNCRNWGAVKYTRTLSHPLIISDKKILSEKGKDTFRMLKSGALEVLWIKSPQQGLHKVLPGAVKRLSYLDGIIVEGNSAIEFLKPDIVIFTLGSSKTLWKSGIERLLAISDIIFYENNAELPKVIRTKRLFHKSFSDKDQNKVFFRIISRLLNEKKTKRRID